MTARRERLAELDRLTTQLRDRADAWARQLRKVEAAVTSGRRDIARLNNSP
jgi:hypothetical protein